MFSLRHSRCRVLWASHNIRALYSVHNNDVCQSMLTLEKMTDNPIQMANENETEWYTHSLNRWWIDFESTQMCFDFFSGLNNISSIQAIGRWTLTAGLEAITQTDQKHSIYIQFIALVGKLIDESTLFIHVRASWSHVSFMIYSRLSVAAKEFLELWSTFFIHFGGRCS